MLSLSQPEGLPPRTFFSMGNDVHVRGHASVIPGDQATVYSSCSKSQESSVLNVNPGCTLYTNNKYKVNITRLSHSGFCLKIVQSEAS